MKYYTRFLFAFVFALSFKGYSQVKIGDNITKINSNSLLELESNTKGFLLPRMTSVQLHAMKDVPVGMMVFSTTDSAICVKRDTGWVIVDLPKIPDNDDWANKGNNIYNKNIGNVGIGTDSPTAKLQVNGDLLLQKGVNISEFSKDSTFTADSHQMVPTEKAIKDYLKSGKFIGGNGNGVGGDNVVPAGTTNQSLNDPVSVVVKGNYAYVTSFFGNQLSVFDISNPANIVAKATTNQNLRFPQSLAVQGNYIYVGNADQLSVFDISDPNVVVAKGTIQENIAQATSVAVQGKYAYVTSYISSQLSIFDISNPDAIVAKGVTNENLDASSSVAVQGNYAYVTSIGNSQLSVFDITDPDKIVLKGSTNKNLSQPSSVVVRGQYAYVTSIVNHNFCIFDVSNPNSIVAKATTSQNLSQPASVKLQGNYAYVSSQINNRLCVFDISNPDLIVAKGYSDKNLSEPSSIAVQGDYVFVTSGGNNTLAAFKYQLTPALPIISGDTLSYSTVLTNYTPLDSLHKYATTESLSQFATKDSLQKYVSLAGSQSVSGQKTFTNTTLFQSKVGFGTTTPYSQLSNTASNTLDTKGYGGNTASSFAWNSSGPGFAGLFYGGSRGLLVKTSSDVGGNALEVSRGPQGGGGTPLLNVLTNGNVGIGTNAPAYKLDVAGDINYTGNLNMGTKYISIQHDLPGHGAANFLIDCPAGYKLIGGGGGALNANASQSGITVNYTGPNPDNPAQWRVLLTNTSTNTITIIYYAICAKVN